MYMNIVQKIGHIIATLCVALSVVACKNDTDTKLTQQQTAIETYLKGSHQPRLIPEADVVNSVEEEPQFYTRWGLDIYRYIASYYAEGRDMKPEIVRGTTFEMIYTAYIFTNGAPSVANMYATNDEESLSKLKNAGLNTSYEWTTDPMRITLGSDNLIPGLETALEGCREGDIVEIYLTYNEAYGNNYIGKVPSNSSVVWFIEITDVIE